MKHGRMKHRRMTHRRMKHRALTDLMASSLGLLVVLDFACLDATNIPTISNDLRDALAETDWNAGAPVASGGQGGSAMTPSAGSGGSAGQDDEPPPDDEANGGAAGSGMAGISGGGGGAGMDPPAPVGEGCDGFAILEQYCATSGCHGQPGAPLGDFASSEEAARAFVGEEGSLACAGQGTIIDTDSPSDSLLVAKVSGDPPCGQAMPPTGEPLTDEEVACLEEWIAGL
jgi:hypothetical protein